MDKTTTQMHVSQMKRAGIKPQQVFRFASMGFVLFATSAIKGCDENINLDPKSETNTTSSTTTTTTSSSSGFSSSSSSLSSSSGFSSSSSFISSTSSFTSSSSSSSSGLSSSSFSSSSSLASGAAFGTEPLTDTGGSTSADSDNDYLTDEQESDFGTDPANPDTDADGYTDGFEATGGYNPLDPASHPQSSGDLKRLGARPFGLKDTDNDGLPDLYEEEAGLSAETVDSDSDRVSDGAKQVCPEASTGAAPDSDGDGLSDGCEAALGTHPFTGDFDRDGLSDLYELLYSSDPANPDTNRNGLVDGWDSSGWHFAFTPKSWHFNDADN